MKLFARLKNGKVPGNSSMDKMMNNIERDLDSTDFDLKKLATDSLFKILPYVLPRESSGNSFQVQINNKISGNGKSTTETTIIGLKDFAAQRLKQIRDVEDRREDKKQIRLKEIGIIENKDE